MSGRVIETERTSDDVTFDALEGAHADTSPAYIVGVGASAGGLEALERLFFRMPVRTGLAFVVVQHLSPDFESLMDELLARRTTIPIRRVEDGMSVQPDCIYLMPPRKEMIISGGRLLLTDKAPSAELTLPIDLFFRSLAQDAGPRAIAVVLSGTGTDGSRGIRDVSDSGGLVISQNEESAKFDGMPRNAMDTGVVDLALPPEEIPDALLKYAAHSDLSDLAPEVVEPAAPKGSMGAILALLRRDLGLDFTQYKPNTVTRRVERRLYLCRLSSVQQYAERLESDPAELNLLYRDLLIGVTRFFRDPEAFDLLRKVVLPDLIQGLPNHEELRVWVAGCATGEEAYSIAILIHEVMQELGRIIPVKIFATDVHRASLDLASVGMYSEQSVADMDPRRLDRYFARVGDRYHISTDVRQMVVFAPHNIARDVPFTRLDLATCRNLLIYLQPHAQKKALSLFQFGLKSGGVLFLGPSESPGQLGDELETIDAHWKLFRKRRDRRPPPPLRVPAQRPLPGLPPPRIAPMPTTGMASMTELLGAYDALLEQRMPPGLLVNERREVVHMFGGAGRYLLVRDGRPSLDVLDLVDPQARVALTGAIQRALKDHTAVAYRGIQVETRDGPTTVELTVQPFHNRRSSERNLLITFEAIDDVQRVEQAQAEMVLDQASRDQLGSLESELRYTKESLQATIEELETSNEELQAANEELVAANEELQSTNEELQSVNEELYTVNAEFQKKIAQLTELTEDMENLLASTDIGTIFLDQDLCIRKFTPKLAETFNLLPQDVGRSIQSFTHSIVDADILADIVRVRDKAVPVEREVRDRLGRWYFLRMHPYRSRKSSVGVVVTLIDLEALKKAEDALFRERYLLDSLMGTVPDLIAFKDTEGRYIRVNAALAGRLGLAAGEAAGRAEADLVPHESADAARAVHDEERYLMRTGQSLVNKLEPSRGPDGRVGYLLTSKLPLRDKEGNVVGIIGISRDITQQKVAEDRARDAVRRRDQFLAMLSHELRNPLGAVLNATHVLARSPSDRATIERALEIVHRQARQMARLLDDLLDVSRVTQNKIELRRKLMDIGPLAREAVAAVRGYLDSHQVETVLDLPSEPMYVFGDESRLQQMLVNLLSNAAKYNKSGGHVWLSVRREAVGPDARPNEPTEDVVIRVKDDGIGITADMLDSVFELFVQSSDTLSRSEGGMGLGLTLVRTIVELHGGRVMAHSDGPGQGAELTVALPAWQGAVPTVDADGAREAEAPTITARRILIIEDNADNRDTTQDLLALDGFEVHVAQDGEEGLGRIVGDRPDVALVDIGLPRLDGYELARRVRAMRGGDAVYLIALTGYGQLADRRRALAAGFDDHLVKPLQPELLRQALARGVAHRPR